MKLKIEKVKLKDRQTKSVYCSSFPKKERMPFVMMVMMSWLWNTSFLSFYDHDKLCGFIYLASFRNVVFVMFFAVDEKMRSNGYGSAILELIQKDYPQKTIYVTIERCDTDAKDILIRLRRRNFYLKNGFIETGYLIRLARVEQEILIKNGLFNKHQLQAFFAFYSVGTMWPKIWPHNMRCKS